MQHMAREKLGSMHFWKCDLTPALDRVDVHTARAVLPPCHSICVRLYSRGHTDDVRHHDHHVSAKFSSHGFDIPDDESGRE